MKQLYKLIFFCLATVFIMACQNDESEIPGGEILKEATFSTSQTIPDSLFTRATDLAFSPGDEIGIYVVKRSNQGIPGTLQDNGNYAHNKRYKIDNNGQLKPYGENDKIYLSGADTYDFYAYYPYNESIGDPKNYEFHVSMDQESSEIYTKNDVMIARNISGTNNSTVSLLFKRKFALVEIYFEKTAGKVVTSASLNTVKNAAVLNIGTNQITTAPNSAKNIKMNLYAENEYFYTYRAILPVQELKGNRLFNFTINGENVYYKATSITPLAEGEKSTYLLNIQYRITAAERDAISGSVTGAEKELFKHGEVIHLMAFPAPNFEFKGWYESPMIGWQEYLTKVSDLPDYSFTATKSMSYIALLEIIKQQINIKITTEGGGVGGDVTGAGLYNQGQPRVLRAKSRSGYLFVGWHDEFGVLVCSTDEYEFIVPNHPVILEARFQKNKCRINIKCSPDQSVLIPDLSLTSSRDYDFGTEITLWGSIITDSPYMFVGWYENGVYLNRDMPMTFTATKDRNLLAKFCLEAFGLGASSSYEVFDKPGYFTKTFTDTYSTHPTYLKAGQRIQQWTGIYYQDLKPEHSLPITITLKELVIKLGERVVLRTNDFEEFIFTAPGNGTYTFHYTAKMEGTLLNGEKTAGTLVINRYAWYPD